MQIIYQLSVYGLDFVKMLCKCNSVREINHYHVLKLCMNIMYINNHIYITSNMLMDTRLS